MPYIVGFFFIIVPLVLFLHERYIISNGIETDATVIRIEKVRGRRWQSYYHSVLSYTVDGKEYETMDPAGVSFPAQVEGEAVRIVYNKDDPNKIVAKSRSRVFAYILFGIIFIIGVNIILYETLSHLS